MRTHECERHTVDLNACECQCPIQRFIILDPFRVIVLYTRVYKNTWVEEELFSMLRAVLKVPSFHLRDRESVSWHAIPGSRGKCRQIGKTKVTGLVDGLLWSQRRTDIKQNEINLNSSIESLWLAMHIQVSLVPILHHSYRSLAVQITLRRPTSEIAVVEDWEQGYIQVSMHSWDATMSCKCIYQDHSSYVKTDSVLL